MISSPALNLFDLPLCTAKRSTSYLCHIVWTVLIVFLVFMLTQAGYKLHDRVIRPAEVGVVKSK